MTSRWIYRLSDGVFMRGGYYDPEFDPAIEGMAEFPDADPHPDVVAERYDASSPTLRRPATAQELAGESQARTAADATATSRRKDILATCALVARSRDVVAWNAMTIAQKVAAVQAEADTWRDIRIFIEDRL